MLIFLIVSLLPGDLIVDFGNKVTEPVACVLIEFTMHVHGIIQKLLVFHPVKPAVVLDLAFDRLRRTPVGLIGNGYRYLNYNVNRTIQLLDQIFIIRTDLMPFLRQKDYRVANHIVEQEPKEQYG